MRRAAVAAALLGACGGYEGPPVGRVVDRAYDDADTVLVPIPCGQNCTTYIPTTSPDRWSLRIAPVGADPDARYHADWLDVPRETYEATETGSCLDTRSLQIVSCEAPSAGAP